MDHTNIVTISTQTQVAQLRRLDPVCSRPNSRDAAVPPSLTPDRSGFRCAQPQFSRGTGWRGKGVGKCKACSTRLTTGGSTWLTTGNTQINRLSGLFSAPQRLRVRQAISAVNRRAEGRPTRLAVNRKFAQQHAKMPSCAESNVLRFRLRSADYRPSASGFGRARCQVCVLYKPSPERFPNIPG